MTIVNEATGMTPEEQAIDDCKYAISLGEAAYSNHIHLWLDAKVSNDGDLEYQKTICKIVLNLGTDRCLLGE